MTKKTIKIAIASQKGGGGKSTITMLLANKLFFEKKQRVLILDCDALQNSCYDVRESELKKIKLIKEKVDKASNGESVKISPDEKTLWRNFLRSYDEYPSVKENFSIQIPKTKKNNDNLDEVVAQLPDYENMGYDVILFDTVGTITTDGKLMGLMKNMDYIFVPIECEDQALKPAIASLTTFLKLSDKHTNSVFGFFNKLKLNEKDQNRCLINILSVATAIHLPLLHTEDNQVAYVDDRAVYRQPIVKSSLIPSIYNKTYKESEGNALLEIICNKIL